MLKKTELKKLQNFLNLQDDKLVENLLVRTVGFLKKNDTNEQALLRILNVIFTDFQHQQNKNKITNTINFNGVKNVVLKRYGKKIIELKNNGYGVRRIAKFLLINHKAKISTTTIYNFLKLQNKGE